ncbi:DUF1178 family protein [Roseibium sp.]|uniref:DUF1178 family protein n=1 Tax=Roseibium sp. TaxID=1936156 RepID=UPI003A97809E
MIRYSLVCDQSHDFEGWFRNSEDFDKQAARSLVSCPHCGSEQVGKRLMAPSVSTARRQEKSAREAVGRAEMELGAATQAADGPVVGSAAPTSPETTDIAAAGSQAVAGSDPQAALVSNDAQQKALVDSLRALRKKVIASSDYVGSDFAEEARKIHYGETDARNIHGETTVKDAKALLEEGVSILPLPVLPEEKN